MGILSDKRTIAFARLPSLMRDTALSFRRLTGLTVVTTLGSASRDRRTRGLLLPPVHPECAKLLRETSGEKPCDAEWQRHLRLAVKVQGCRIHTCPLGIRCASVPIVLGDELLGLAKFVSGPEISRERFRSLVDLLQVLIARPCQELHILFLQEQIDALHVSLNRLRRVKRPVRRPGNDPFPDNGRNGSDSPKGQTLIRQILDYLDEHYADSGLSLVQVARAVDRNEKYVTHLFARQVGERMRTYITTLRIRRGCELLLQTNRTIEQIAHDSGFAHAVQFRQSFRGTMGVTATEYRLLFSARA